MIIDNLGTLSGTWSNGTWTPQSIFANGASVLSTYSYDTAGGTSKAQAIDLGAGSKALKAAIEIVAAVTGGTSVEFQIVTADDAALSVNLTTIGSSGAIAVAKLTAGAQIVVDIPRANVNATRRYIGISYVNVGINAAGTAIASLVLDVQDMLNANNNYASGFTLK